MGEVDPAGNRLVHAEGSSAEGKHGAALWSGRTCRTTIVAESRTRSADVQKVYQEIHPVQLSGDRRSARVRWTKSRLPRRRSSDLNHCVDLSHRGLKDLKTNLRCIGRWAEA